MRVSDQMRVRLAFNGLSKPRDELGEVQEQVTSGRVVNRPSDAPSEAARILDLREALADVSEYKDNASTGRTILGASEEALAAAERVFVRAGELGVQMANSTMSASDRKSAAIEVRGAMEHLVDLMNTQSGDVFVFGGYLTQFKGAAPLDKPWQADGTYNGDDNTIDFDMGDGVRLPVTTPAQSAFAGLMGVLDTFATALEADDVAGIETSIDQLSVGRDQLDGARSDVGTKLNRIQFAGDVLDRTEIDVRQQLSDTEDADMLEVMARFRQEEIALQAALQMASRIFQPTLMDFLK